MKVCCVEGCGGPKNEDPVYFDFPTSRLHRKRWLDAINSPKLSQDAVICIRHFHNRDYELIRGKTRLKSKVLPTLLVGDDKSKNDEDTKISQDTPETAANDKTSHDNTTENGSTTNNNKNNDNGKVYNDNGKNCDKENNETANNNIEDSSNISRGNEGVNSDKKDTQCNTENGHKDNNNSDNNSRTDNGEENNDNGKVDSDKSGNKRTNNSIANNTDKVDGETTVNNNTVPSTTAKLDKDNRKVDNDSGKVDNDNGKVDKKNNETVASDNGKVRTGRKTRCKITAMRAVTRRDPSSDSDVSSQDSVSSSPVHKSEVETNKDDIEGILTHYYIENKKTERQVAAMADVMLEDLEKREGRAAEGERRGEGWYEPSEPVFIELSVGQGGGAEQSTENDCLMVLESVQCEVDPAMLFADDEPGGEPGGEGALEGGGPAARRSQHVDPISLLTSSDEDDVIIQEPKIDTVEVSSADTSEDDVPLVKLVKPPRPQKPTNRVDKAGKSKRKNLITKLLWGGTDFYCVHCRFTTVSASEYTKHMAIHSKVLQLCQDCGFTTCSKAQMLRHKQKHKNERRYNCRVCNYTAKHKMSLVYHMKTHTNVNELEVAICDTFEPASKKSKMGDKKHSCSMCEYSTNRRSDLKRHRKTHKIDDSDDGDDEYVP